MFIADILRSPRLTSARNIHQFFIIKPFGITDCVSRVIYTACIRFCIPSLSAGWVRHKRLNSCASQLFYHLINGGCENGSSLISPLSRRIDYRIQKILVQCFPWDSLPFRLNLHFPELKCSIRIT